MADLQPFRALRPSPERAPHVASPPYDVVNTAEARALAVGNPDSFLRVSRPEIDLPDGTDEHDAVVYRKGKHNLDDLVARGVLSQDPEPHVYVYAQRMGSHRQTGVVACALVSEYERGAIRKHENTRPDKEDDRTRHIDALSAHDEPVFLTYRARRDIDEEVERVKGARPAYHFETADGVEHTLWVATTEAGMRLARLFREVAALYVADGHHRSAAAARVHALRAGKSGDHATFLSVCFPHDQMQIMAYNRLVRDRRGKGAAALLAELGARMDVVPADRPEPSGPLAFGVYCGGRWWQARARPGSYDARDPVASLDCSIAQDQILAPIFDIVDPRLDVNVDFVGGIRGAAELERRVAKEGWAMALHLYPTRVEQLMAVADAGRLMPPKSTWFEPKLRSGLFVHAF
jgi:uncharacterized protein (DUF1015 family)